jgi:hypothetical protein
MPLPSLHFYCDETSHREHQYAAVSGIAVRKERIAIIDQEIMNLKSSFGKQVASELKWSKVNRHDMPLYEALCDYFFSLLEARHIHYHVVICDFVQYDHRTLNRGNRSTSVSKTYYQLILHRCCKYYGDRAEVHIRPDGGDCTSDLPRFRHVLNSEARRRFGVRSDPIRSVDLISSVTAPMLQMNDVILGAISSHRNGRHLMPNASPHKTHLAEYVRSSFGLRTYGINTSQRQTHFTLWNWRGVIRKRP